MMIVVGFSIWRPYKKAVLSQSRPRDAPYISLP